MSDDAGKALQVFKDGGIVIFPTDTAFGIGCRMDNEASVDRLFEIRKRPISQATPVLVSSVDMVRGYVMDIPSYALTLMKHYWPGALTIVLPSKTAKIPAKVRGGGNTIGLRLPAHDDLRVIIKTLGVPILGPSANIHGGATPFMMEDLDENLVKLVDFVLPGSCSRKFVSTVVDCTGSQPIIIRQGAVQI